MACIARGRRGERFALLRNRASAARGGKCAAPGQRPACPQRCIGCPGDMGALRGAGWRRARADPAATGGQALPKERALLDLVAAAVPIRRALRRHERYARQRRILRTAGPNDQRAGRLQRESHLEDDADHRQVRATVPKRGLTVLRTEAPAATGSAVGKACWRFLTSPLFPGIALPPRPMRRRSGAAVSASTEHGPTG